MARKQMSTDRYGITRRFKISYQEEGQDRELKFYVVANVDEDLMLREIFVKGDKIGGLLGGVLDTVAIMISIALQHGVPMRDITEKMRYNKFGPRTTMLGKCPRMT